MIQLGIHFSKKCCENSIKTNLEAELQYKRYFKQMFLSLGSLIALFGFLQKKMWKLSTNVVGIYIYGQLKRFGCKIGLETKTFREKLAVKILL